MSHDHDHHDHDHHDDHHECGCRHECRDLRKRAKHTHVAGANCCSSFRNVFSRRHRRCH